MNQSEIFKILLVLVQPGSVRNFEFYARSGPVQRIGNTVPLILYYSMTGLDQYKHKILNLGPNPAEPGPTKIRKSRIGRSLVENADSRFLNFPVLVPSVLDFVRDQPALVLEFWFGYLYLFLTLNFEQTCKVSKRTSFDIPPSFSRFVSSDSSSNQASEKSDT